VRDRDGIEARFGLEYITESRRVVGGPDFGRSNVLMLTAAWRRQNIETLLRPANGYYLDGKVGVTLGKLLSSAPLARVKANAGYYFTPENKKIGTLVLRGELGYVYLALGDADKALECMLKVKPKERSAPVNYADLCEALVKAYLMKGKYQEALACAAECKYAAQWLGDPYIHTLTWNIHADIYRAQGRYDECRTAALKAWSIDSVSINTAPVSAFNIAFASAMLGRRDEAARFFGLYDRMMNERTDRNYHEALSQMEVVYETEKKQQQIASLEKERGFYIVMGVSGALIFLLVFGLRFYRHRLNRPPIPTR